MRRLGRRAALLFFLIVPLVSSDRGDAKIPAASFAPHCQSDDEGRLLRCQLSHPSRDRLTALWVRWGQTGMRRLIPLASQGDEGSSVFFLLRVPPTGAETVQLTANFANGEKALGVFRLTRHGSLLPLRDPATFSPTFFRDLNAIFASPGSARADGSFGLVISGVFTTFALAGLGAWFWRMRRVPVSLSDFPGLAAQVKRTEKMMDDQPPSAISQAENVFVADSQGKGEHCEFSSDSPDVRQADETEDRENTASPLESIHGWLHVLGEETRRLPLDKPLIHIGRHEDNEICLTDLTVHRHHALLHVSAEGRTIITDLSGERGNGVRVNGHYVQQVALHDGDLIELGQVQARFRTISP